MVSESMATHTAAIAMADFMKRMVNSSPNWTGDARALQSRRFENGALRPDVCRYAEHYPLPGSGHSYAPGSG
jgi:hypothetical protein